MVGLDVAGDGFRKQVGAGLTCVQAFAQFGRGDVFVNRLKQMDAGLLLRSELEGREIVERKARATDYDPLGQLKQPVGLVPTGKAEKAVCADEVEENSLGHRLLQCGESVCGVVGEAVGSGGVDRGGLKTAVLFAGQRGHSKAVGEGRRVFVEFQRLAACRSEEYGVHVKSIGGSRGYLEMATMRWIEGAAE